MKLEREIQTSTTRKIWSHTGDATCELLCGKHEDAKLFEDVLSIRCRTDMRWPDQRTPVDAHSDHYCIYVNNEPVGSLGVSRALEGDIFLQEYCPPALLDEFGDCLVSAYRFRILDLYRRTSTHAPGVTLSLEMIREGWRDQIAKGAALDLINIEKTHVPLYRRLGYLLCEGYDYLDPILGTASSLMFLPIDPDRKSFIQDIIRQSDLHVSEADVLRCLNRSQVYVRAVNS